MLQFLSFMLHRGQAAEKISGKLVTEPRRIVGLAPSHNATAEQLCVWKQTVIQWPEIYSLFTFF